MNASAPTHQDLSGLLAIGRTRATQRATYLRWSPDGGELREVGYQQAVGRIDRTGALFASWGLGPGSSILVATADDEALATVFLACLVHGQTAMVVDHHARPSEVAQLMEIRRPDAVVLDRALLDAWPLEGIAHRLAIGGTVKRSLVGRLLRRGPEPQPAGPPTFPEAVDGLPPAAPPSDLDPESDAYVLFTSGSTSRPKGVRLSRRALAAHARTLIARWGYDADARILDILPLHHTDGLIQGVFCAWACGGTCVRSGAFEVARTVELLLDPIYRERITHLVAVPTMLAMVLQYGNAEAGAFATPDFRFVISAAGYLDERIWTAFEERFRVRVCNIYGLTETVTGGCFAGPDDRSHVIGTVGVPVDCEVRVVDDVGAGAASGEPGELLMRGDHLMSGYLNDPAATTAAMTDGWLRTGDLATVDAGGLVRIVGRKKNLVISGGLNIQPEEVGEVLRALPGVADAVAFGIPDPTFTEILVACVSAGDGVALDAEVLIRSCRERLSAFKVPKAIVQLPSLPYGPSGKVMVPKVRELYLQSRLAAGQDRHGDLRSRINAIAAAAFHVPAERLRPDAAPGRTPGWDSFAHLAFITGLESAFAIRLKPADIMAIRTLGDAEAVVRKLTHA